MIAYYMYFATIFHHWAYAASANNVKHDIFKWQNQGKSLKLHIGRDIFLVLNKKHDFLCAEDKKCHGMKMDAIPATIMTRVPKCQMFVKMIGCSVANLSSSYYYGFKEYRCHISTLYEN